MGWKVSRLRDKYRIWSTITDSWQTSWIDRREAIAFYYESALVDFKKDIIKKYLLFPHHWGSYDGKLMVDYDRNEAYCKWMQELMDKPDEQYCKFIDETFSSVTKQLGIEESK
jgi:hypothetical protein